MSAKLNYQVKFPHIIYKRQEFPSAFSEHPSSLYYFNKISLLLNEANNGMGKRHYLSFVIAAVHGKTMGESQAFRNSYLPWGSYSAILVRSLFLSCKRTITVCFIG